MFWAISGGAWIADLRDQSVHDCVNGPLLKQLVDSSMYSTLAVVTGHCNVFREAQMLAHIHSAEGSQ